MYFRVASGSQITTAPLFWAIPLALKKMFRIFVG